MCPSEKESEKQDLHQMLAITIQHTLQIKRWLKYPYVLTTAAPHDIIYLAMCLTLPTRRPKDNHEITFHCLNYCKSWWTFCYSWEVDLETLPNLWRSQWIRYFEFPTTTQKLRLETKHLGLLFDPQHKKEGMWGTSLRPRGLKEKNCDLLHPHSTITAEWVGTHLIPAN